MKVLAIDPSVNFVGWTLFDSKKKGKPTRQWKWGTIRVEGHNYQMKLVMLLQTLGELGLLDVDHLVTEWPTFFSSEKGQMAAHQNYTIDLGGVCAFLAGSMGLDHRRWHLLTATAWKGSVSKYVTGRKFFRVFRIDPNHLSEHEIDSTMMLRYWLIEYGATAFQRADEDFPESPLLRS